MIVEVDVVGEGVKARLGRAKSLYEGRMTIQSVDGSEFRIGSMTL